MNKGAYFSIGSVLIAAISLIRCSGAPVAPAPGSAASAEARVESTILHPLGLPMDPRPARIEPLWRKPMPGLIGDLSLSLDGSTALVATSPNRELVPGGATRPTVSAWSTGSGKLLWKKLLPAPVKAQGISADGRIAVAANYDDELAAWNEKGRELWQVPAMCEPHVMEKGDVACYHDDDAEPGVAFRVYAKDGSPKSEFPITNDILAFAVSSDLRNVAFGLTAGSVVRAAPPEFKAAWRKKVKGEVLAVAVASGAAPRTAVLTSARELVLLSAEGEVLASRKPSGRADQIAFSPSGDALWIWGNTASGQFLSRLSLPGLEEQWLLSEKRQADLVSTLAITGSGEEETAVVGFEDVFARAGAGTGARAKHHHILGVGPDGKVRWNVAFEPEANVYLIAAARIGTEKWRLAVATDDGHVWGYEITR